MKRIRRKKTKEKVNISRFIIPIILSLIVIGISIDYNLTINKDLNPNYLFSKYSFNIFKYLLQKQPIFRAPLNNPPVFDPASLPNVNQLLEDTNYYFDLISAFNFLIVSSSKVIEILSFISNTL